MNERPDITPDAVTPEIAAKKLRAMRQTAEILRAEYAEKGVQ